MSYPEIRVFMLYRILKEVSVYNLFYLFGYYFYKRLHFKKMVLISFLALCALILLSPFYPHDMQVNKFPPNLFFIVYNSFILSLLSIAFTFIKLPTNEQLIGVWNKQGYDIYIYQSYYFCITVFIIKLIQHIFGGNIPIIFYLFIAIIIIYFCGFITGKLFNIKLIHNIFA